MADEVVLVTGVSGYVGCHVARQLMEEGYRVRGTVRNAEDEGKVTPLKSLFEGFKHEIELVSADLNKDEGWEGVVSGCTAVMHVASPFPDVSVRNVSEEEVVVPAREGTLRVLRAVAKTNGAVRRVVLTSSFVSVAGESTAEQTKKYNEEDWTDPDSPNIDVYTKSKVLAEKAAWDFMKDLPEEQKFELAVINPTLVMGPPLLHAQKTGTSISLMTNILTKYPAVPRVMFPICDVRDVAKAHVKALTVQEAAGHRHIIASESVWMKEIATSVAKEFRPQGYCVATSQLPYAALWLAGLFNKGLRHTILPRVGKTLYADNKRMVEVLGVEPTPTDSTFQDMVYAMVDLGIVKKAKKYKQVGSRAEVAVVNGEVEEEGKKKEEEEEKKKEEDGEKELEPEDKEKKNEEIKNNEKQEENEKEKEDKKTKETEDKQKKEEKEEEEEK